MHLPEHHHIIEILRKHNSYVTQPRIAVLKVISQTKGSLSLSGIIKLSPVELERTTVYRTLQYFLAKGIIVNIPNPRGNPRYIFADLLRLTSDGPVKDRLVYFLCEKCGYTEMIEQNTTTDFAIPGRFEITRSYIVFEGRCHHCK